jgi:enterochelin esterase family protein
MRVALLGPGPRDDTYSANPAYTARLVDQLVPWLTSRYPTTHRPVLLGQSLGALAALHAGWSAPDLFAGLALQSGSFFTPELDPQESGFTFFDRVAAFVAEVSTARAAPPRLPMLAMTCGTAEENLANNRRLRDHLRRIGVTVTWGEARQGHTWTCWRDTLDPHLTDLLREVWT